MKLNIKALCFSLAITFGLSMFLLGLAGAWLNWGVDFINVLGSFYVGFAPTFVGSIIGAIWGLVLGGVFGIVISWFYNLFVVEKK